MAIDGDSPTFCLRQIILAINEVHHDPACNPGQNGGVTQLVEYDTFNVRVRGSSPLTLTTWGSSLRGLSGGLKNRRMKDRYLPVPPLLPVKRVSIIVDNITPLCYTIITPKGEERKELI